MVNESELLINVRFWKQAKDADRLEPKGKWSGLEVTIFSNADVAPPAKRQNLTYSGIYAERGKPVIVLCKKESKPSGEPMRLQVWDSRKSEGFAVMAEIRVATLLGVKTSRLRCWSFSTRNRAGIHS